MTLKEQLQELASEKNTVCVSISLNTHRTHSDKSSDPEHLDNLVREYLNNMYKALVKVHNATGLRCVVISTGDNYSRLQQVADKPHVYFGHADINYNNLSRRQIAHQGWAIIQRIQLERKAEAITAIKEAVAEGKVLTDLQEIFQASVDGRGELLIVHEDFIQPVLMKDERTFDLVDDVTISNAIDDNTSNIAWVVISKKGSTIFTSQDEIKDLGEIVLKTRY